MRIVVSFVFLLALSVVAVPGHADWHAFRGSNSNGVVNTSLPTKCDQENIVWKAELPGRGVSSPIVVADQVILTASSGVRQDRLHVVGVDTATGQKSWHRQFWATGRTLTHPTSANAAPTPVSDGEHIVAFFSSNDLVCLGSDGALKWYRGLGSDYPRAGNDVGMASSPMLHAGVVVCQVECQGDSFVEAIDVETGKQLWRLERTRAANWTSPVYLAGETEMVLLKSNQSVAAHDLRSGELVWQVDGEFGGIPSMVVASDHVFVPGGIFTVLKRGPEMATVAWESNRIRPDASPIVHDGQILSVNSAGVLGCYASDTGAPQWEFRVGGKHWASPLVADGHVYMVNQNGELNIIQLGQRAKKIAEYDFGEDVFGTPAASEGALYVRSVAHLWKVAEQ